MFKDLYLGIESDKNGFSFFYISLINLFIKDIFKGM